MPDASVSEHFYQLHLVQRSTMPTPRLDMVEPRPPRRMSRRQRWGMLLFLVGLPYVRIKAQQYFERLRSEDLDVEDQGQGRGRAGWTVPRVDTRVSQLPYSLQKDCPWIRS